MSDERGTLAAERPRRAFLATLTVETADGTFPAHRDYFADVFDAAVNRGRSVQGTRFRAADPDAPYKREALAAVEVACRQLELPRAYVAFVAEADGPQGGLGFRGFTDATHDALLYVVVDRVPLHDLRRIVRHEVYHLAYRAKVRKLDPGHRGPSEAGARRFETGPWPV